MPNAKVLSEKQAIVESLSEKLKNAAAGVIVDYKGITVAEDTELRKACRENDVEYAVIKNTMLRRAFNNVGLEALDDQLNGTTSLAIASDPVSPARVVAEFAKKLEGKF
jgi:large subunit ribosomal protein L10